MLWWWIAVEVFFVAFFVYGWVIYKRRVEEYRRRDADSEGDRTS
jgi:hypothetical protein